MVSVAHTEHARDAQVGHFRRAADDPWAKARQLLQEGGEPHVVGLQHSAGPGRGPGRQAYRFDALERGGREPHAVSRPDDPAFAAVVEDHFHPVFQHVQRRAPVERAHAEAGAEGAQPSVGGVDQEGPRPGMRVARGFDIDFSAFEPHQARAVGVAHRDMGRRVESHRAAVGQHQGPVLAHAGAVDAIGFAAQRLVAEPAGRQRDAQRGQGLEHRASIAPALAREDGYAHLGSDRAECEAQLFGALPGLFVLGPRLAPAFERLVVDGAGFAGMQACQPTRGFTDDLWVERRGGFRAGHDGSAQRAQAQFESLRHVALDRAVTQSRADGDLRIRQALELRQHEHFARPRRQLGQHGVEPLQLLLHRDELFWRVGDVVGKVGERLQPRLFECPAPPVIVEQAAGDGGQEGARIDDAGNLVRSAQQAQEGVVRKVHRVIGTVEPLTQPAA